MKLTIMATTNRAFLQKYPLEFSLPYREAQALRKILNKLSERFILDVEEAVGVKTNIQYYDFKVVCPTTRFQDAYFAIGIAYAEKVFPIWNKRYEKKRA